MQAVSANATMAHQIAVEEGHETRLSSEEHASYEILDLIRVLF